MTKSSERAFTKELLQDINVLLHLDSPKGDYRVEYYTSVTKNPDTGDETYTRTYRLRDLLRGNVSLEPWDKFDLHKQVDLVSNLMDLSGYQVSKAVKGWKVECPKCGSTISGKMWQTPPKTCRTNGCKHEIDPATVVELSALLAD